eukprot:m.97393 g.97393  ORF g.97393 m.97393 type:complete len:58 (+) comp15221_c0_seq1:143-316(+)
MPSHIHYTKLPSCCSHSVSSGVAGGRFMARFRRKPSVEPCLLAGDATVLFPLLLTTG